MALLIVMMSMEGESLTHSEAVSKWGGMGNGLEVWYGEWWRLWITQLHHADLLHLIGNLWCFLFLGRIMEPRLGVTRYALFLLGAAGAAGVLQTLTGPMFVGISGVVCAQFGCLIVECDRDPKLASRFPDTVLYAIVAGICFGIVLEWTDTFPIGNACHFGGLFYGIAWGKIDAALKSPAFRRVVWITSHLLLIPCVYSVTRPWWNADYYWALGDHASSVSEKIRYYELGLKRDPGHSRLHHNLAVVYLQQGEYLKAWDAILGAINACPSNPKTLELAQQIGRSPYIRLRLLFEEENPRTILQKHFGDKAPQWEQTLMNDPVQVESKSNRPSLSAAPLPDDMESAIPFRLEVPPAKENLPHPDPQAPWSAVEGVSI